MEKSSVGIIIAFALAILVGVIFIQIIASETALKSQLYMVTDSFRLVRVPDGGLYNTSVGINTTYTYTLSKVNDAWRQDITECAKKAIVDPSGSPATGNLWIYNSSGNILANGADYVVVSGVNSITFKNVENVNGTANTATAVYKTCPTEYVNGWGKTVFQLVPGFFALAILIGGAFIIFYVLKNEGISLDI